MLYRAVNAAGWMPGIPQEVYMTQMALGETGAGLGLPLVAGGMGIVGAGLAALGLNAAMVNQNRTAEQLAASVGTLPATAFATGGAVAGQLAALEGQYHLRPGQAGQIAAGLAAGGLDRGKALGDGLTQAANLLNVFGLSVEQVTKLLVSQYTELGRSTEDVSGLLSDLARVAENSGLPAGSLAALVAASPDLAANLRNPAQLSQASGLYKQLYGDDTLAQQMTSLANAHGIAAYALAGMLGMSVEGLDQLRGTATGQAQIADAIDARARELNTRLGSEAGFSSFNAFLQNAGQGTVSWQDWQKILRTPLAASLPSAAPPKVPPPPGGAQEALGQTAAGNLAAGARAAQPWNVPSMTVNAANVTLAGVGNQLGEIGTVLGGNPSPAQLAAIAQGGGLAGNLALASQAANGVPGALGRLLDDIGTGIFGPSDLKHGLTVGAGAPGWVQAVAHTLHLTVDVRQNGQVIGTKQVTSPLPNSGQSYGQYTPQRPGGPR